MRNRVLTVAVMSVLLLSMAAPAFAHAGDAPVLTFSFTFQFRMELIIPPGRLHPG